MCDVWPHLLAGTCGLWSNFMVLSNFNVSTSVSLIMLVCCCKWSWCNADWGWGGFVVKRDNFHNHIHPNCHFVHFIEVYAMLSINVYWPFHGMSLIHHLMA